MVAVLFTDIVGSTDLMSQLGEASFDEVRRAHFAALAQAIERTGGDEIKNTGDGVMATFGSVVDAVGCAVAMQQATTRHARTAGAALAIRVGLSVGEVTFEDDDVFGTPVVEAARLVAAAGGGQILTTAIARALAGGRAEVEFSDLGPLELKGLAQPVVACEVLWEPLPEPPIPMPALLTDVGPIFVGRDAEVERLSQLWKEVVAGELRVGLLAGEPGVGKTRLVAEVAETAHAEGAVVVAGRCDEDLGVPYQPFVEALRHFVDHTPEARLQSGLGRHAGELVRLVPELPTRVANLPPLLTSDPETERYRLFDAVAAWLAAASADEPTLLILDDLQWAAKPTLLLLRHVVRSPDPMRLLILGTYRDTELSHDHPLVELLADLRRQGGVERLSLSGLDQLGVIAFMAQSAGHEIDDEGLALARAIHTETEGNPFFVREILRHLAETGGIEQQGGRWTTRLPVEELGIPEGIREVVGRRLSRLSGKANRALRVAAIVGTEFEIAVLEAAGDIDQENLLSALEEATDARLVIEAPGARYRFVHALVRDTLYGEVTAARRVDLHHRAAEAIEALHASALDDYLPALAHHWARAAAPAAETARAVDYAARAGDRALAQLAHDEAVSYYRSALELLDAAKGPSPDSPRRLELLIALGEAQRRAGNPSHRETLLDAARLAHAQGDAGALARAALANTRGMLGGGGVGGADRERLEMLKAALAATGEGNTAVRARLLATLALELPSYEEETRRFRLSDEALDIARRVADQATLAGVLVARFYAINTPTTLSERLANTAELLEVAQGLDDPVLRCRAALLRHRCLAETAEVEEATRCLESGEHLAAELGQPAVLWAAAWNRAGWFVRPGRLEEADHAVHSALELGQAAGQPDALLFFAVQMAVVRREQGRLGEYEEILRGAFEEFPAFPLVRAHLAEGYCDLGQEADARAIFESLAANRFAALFFDFTWMMAVSASTRVAIHLGDLASAEILYEVLAPYADRIVHSTTAGSGTAAHYLGLLASALGRFEDAAAHFSVAEATETRIGAPVWLARTRLEWARMLLARGQPSDSERARELLVRALTTARELGLGNVEPQIVALLQ